jgi:uncharacterized protein YxeA
MKKITLAILALVVVTVTTAFTWQRNDDTANKEVSTAYFQYQLSTTSGENDAENWKKVADPDNLCASGANVLCTIMAPIANPTDIHPDFTGISDVRNSQSISARVFKP